MMTNALAPSEAAAFANHLRHSHPIELSVQGRRDFEPEVKKCSIQLLDLLALPKSSEGASTMYWSGQEVWNLVVENRDLIIIQLTSVGPSIPADPRFRPLLTFEVFESK